jgi:UDP-N-acetylglucosamine:LPS N-acetylglucosamine transferase
MMAIEKTSPDELLADFTKQYNTLLQENEGLAKKIKENEITILKLAGAIETLNYLNQPEETEEKIEE